MCYGTRGQTIIRDHSPARLRANHVRPRAAARFVSQGATTQPIVERGLAAFEIDLRSCAARIGSGGRNDSAAGFFLRATDCSLPGRRGTQQAAQVAGCRPAVDPVPRKMRQTPCRRAQRSSDRATRLRPHARAASTMNSVRLLPCRRRPIDQVACAGLQAKIHRCIACWLRRFRLQPTCADSCLHSKHTTLYIHCQYMTHRPTDSANTAARSARCGRRLVGCSRGSRWLRGSSSAQLMS